MPTTPSTTRWRNEPLVPDDWEDVRKLKRMANRVRNRIVVFDWGLSETDLRRLRDTVYAWSAGVRGRYRKFDSRVIGAINEALQEMDTEYFVKEPGSPKNLDAEVDCVPVEDGYRLQGHAPFDVVFGYGRTAAGGHPAHVSRLGDSLRDVLATTVGALGWDFERLSQPELRGVLNRIYGSHSDEGVPPKPIPATGPTSELDVRFAGPFAAVNGEGVPTLFDSDFARERGVYLWTLEIDGRYHVTYAGQTGRSFGLRTGEHLAAMLSGQYWAYEPDSLLQGDRRLVWPNPPEEYDWPQAIPTFLENHREILPKVVEHIRMVRFFVAPVPGDRVMRRRVEGGIGRYYRGHENEEVRKHFPSGIQLPRPAPHLEQVRLRISSEAPIAALPPTLDV